MIDYQITSGLEGGTVYASRMEVETIIAKLCGEVTRIFPQDKIDAILFGSYSRGDAEFGSDIDVLLLVDSSREAIAEKNWQIGEIASVLFMDYGVMVSPIVENRKYYQDRIDLLPFFGNIDREGVKLSA